MKYTLLELNNTDENDDIDDSNNNNNNNKNKKNNAKKQRTKYIHSPIRKTTTTNSNSRNNDILYESFCSLDINYTNSIFLNDVYTIYLAHEYLPKELTYIQFQKRINSSSISNLQSDHQRYKYNFDEVCTIFESYFIQNSIYNTDKYWNECFHLFTKTISKQQQQSTTTTCTTDNNDEHNQQQKEEEEHHKQKRNHNQCILLMPHDIVTVSNEICSAVDGETTASASTSTTVNDNEDDAHTTTNRVRDRHIHKKQNILHINQSLAERMINYCKNNDNNIDDIKSNNQLEETTPTTLNNTNTNTNTNTDDTTTVMNGLTLKKFVHFFAR